MQYAYPAIFTPEQVAGRGTVYTVEIPDILGCVTEGESIPTAIEMAREALAGCITAMLHRGEPIPAPSDIHAVCCGDGFVSLVDVDISE